MKNNFKFFFFIVIGILLMLFYMMKFKLGTFDEQIPDLSEWWFGISPEGFGSIAMLCNFCVSIIVSTLSSPPPKYIEELVNKIRVPE